MIISGIFSSLSIKLLHLVIDGHTLSSIWQTLKQSLASPSNSYIMHLHGSFQDLLQGETRSVSIYKRLNLPLTSLLPLDNPLLWQTSISIFLGVFMEDSKTWLLASPRKLGHLCILSCIIIYLLKNIFKKVLLWPTFQPLYYLPRPVALLPSLLNVNPISFMANQWVVLTTLLPWF